MHVLIAEDEVKTRQHIDQGLSELGFTVEAVDNGAHALALLREHAFDVAVLDIMLPGMDGWSIVRALRAESNRTPVLFLTARDRVDDRVRGFELGADDYLVKPFAFAELLARIRNLAGRGAPQVSVETLRVGDLSIDVMRHRVERAGHLLHLTPREYALLLLLARQPGRVFTRTLIAESVWGVCHQAQTNVVDVVVRRLRAKLDTPFDTPLLHTVRGVGYALEQRDA